MSEDRMIYPTDSVIGVLDDPSGVDDLLDQLREAGASDDHLQVLQGAEDAGVRPDPSEGGVAKTIVRTAQKVLGDEAERLHVLDDALEAGAAVVCVKVATGKDEEDARDEELARLGRVFREAGARDVAFYGEYQIQQLDAGGT